MRIARWRIALTAGAIVVLTVAGIGLVQAGSAPAATSQAQAADDMALAALDPNQAAAGAANEPRGERLRRWRERWERLVTAQVTVNMADKGIVTFRLDHGKVMAIASDSLTVKEADGSSVVLKTDQETRLRKDGGRQPLDKLAVGDEVFIRSPKIDGSFVARLIVVPNG